MAASSPGAAQSVHPDEAVIRAVRLLDARIAGQFGLVTRVQARAAGLTDSHLTWQVKSGRWTRLHTGVYLTTPGRDDWEMHALAAVLAVGVPSVLAGPSAAAAWGLVPQTGREFTVMVPRWRAGSSRPGITVSRSRFFDERVHPTAWPPRTTVEHTVLDLAAGSEADRIVALMAKACQLRLATPQSLSRALGQRTAQPHRGIIEESLGLVGEGAESSAEVRYIRDVERAHGLPPGRRQVTQAGERRDTTYEEFMTVVEIDGQLGHAGWDHRQRDLRRDRRNAAQGRLTVRGGWVDVAIEPCRFAADVAQILQSRGWAGQPTACSRPGCSVKRRAA